MVISSFGLWKSLSGMAFLAVFTYPLLPQWFCFPRAGRTCFFKQMWLRQFADKILYYAETCYWPGHGSEYPKLKSVILVRKHTLRTFPQRGKRGYHNGDKGRRVKANKDIPNTRNVLN